jgi:hypothetical protein
MQCDVDWDTKEDDIEVAGINNDRKKQMSRIISQKT